MQSAQTSTSVGTKTHARTPVVILLPHDLKRLVEFVRSVVVERQNRPATSENESGRSVSEDSDVPSSRMPD